MRLMKFEVDKPSKILIKTLNAMEFIKLNTQDNEAQGTDNPIIYYV